MQISIAYIHLSADKTLERLGDIDRLIKLDNAPIDSVY
jgi:hypothetical protein